MKTNHGEVESQRVQKFLQQVQVDDQSTLPSMHHSFVASGSCIEPDAPALNKKNSSGQSVTHTHILYIYIYKHIYTQIYIYIYILTHKKRSIHAIANQLGCCKVSGLF